jgi:hypothetical protein
MDEYIVDTSSSFTWGGYLFLLVVGFVVALFVIGIAAYGIWKLKRLLTRPEMVGMTREQVLRRWQEVRKTGRQGIMGAKLAIFEADTLLDSGLKSMMMPGETLGERLKVACYKYPRLRNVWWAHKLRNQLAHDSSFQLTRREAERALDEFERALKVLNVL